MNMKRYTQWAFAGAVFFAITTGTISAQITDGGITPKILEQIQTSYQNTPDDRALGNAIRQLPIKTLAINTEGHYKLDNYFSDEVKSKGITNQKSSGRCWLFSGLNVFRSEFINKNGTGDFQFSQNYIFFYDQLEKSNLFLQGIINTSKKPMEDKLVVWLFRHSLSDGGQFTGVSDLLSKYGVVPAEVMPETNSSNNTSTMAQMIVLKLKEFALELRKMKADGEKKKAIESRKIEQLGVVYRMLVLNLGQPPKSFEYTLRNDKGKVISTNTYTPKSFFDTFIGRDLRDEYVLLMNDPTRPYYKLYEINYDRHMYDGANWKYVNIPVEDIKKMAVESIKDQNMMYFSCDVGKAFSRKDGTLDMNNYDYGDLFGVKFGMDKKQRIETFASGSSHAMTLMAVNIVNGVPDKWKVENSWGEGPNKGHLIISDKWFDNYMFRLVVDKKYATSKVMDILKTKAILLPPWDPMFSDED